MIKKLLLIALTAIMPFTLTACSEALAVVTDKIPIEIKIKTKEKVKEETPEIIISETPEQVITNIMTAIKNVNAEELEKYRVEALIGETDELNNERNMKIFETIEYEIISSQELENLAEVEIKITTKDLTNVSQDYADKSKALTKENEKLGEGKLDEAAMQKKYSDLFIDIIDKCEYEEFSQILNLKLEKDEDKWNLSLDSLFQNAIYGNILFSQKDVVWSEELIVYE